MLIFPAIDIKEGKCVRLYQGKIEEETIYHNDPIAIAKKWQERGGEFLHVVDLDGAFLGKPQNSNIIRSIIKEVKIPVQIGGGIRDIETAKEIIGMGAERIIVGTSVIKNKNYLSDLVKLFGEKIVVSVDVKDGFVCTDGWVSKSDVNVIDFIKELENMRVKTIIYTDISKDGTMKGPNYEEISTLIDITDIDFIASGGIGSLNDIKMLEKLGVYGVVIGRALYENKIRLEDIRGI